MQQYNYDQPWQSPYNAGGYPQQRSYGGGYSQPRYNGYPQNYIQLPQQPRKKSGAKCKHFTITKGPNAGVPRICTSGWNVSRKGGLNTFLCTTTNKSQDAGKGWVGSVRCEVTNKATHQMRVLWGTMQVSTGKVVIPDLGIVINPKAPNGGYCGKFTTSKRR